MTLYSIRRRMLDGFDRFVGPRLYHHAGCAFSWKEGRSGDPRFVLKVNRFAGEVPTLDQERVIEVARRGAWQWLVDVPDEWRASRYWPEIADMLDYYLCDLEGRYPPNYLVHHCGTTANAYDAFTWSLVHADRLPRWHATGPRF